jgi:hypothetical protein
MPHDSLLNRIRSEFLEMPGQRLTRAQAQRLYGINELQCQRALDTLVDTRFLCVKPDGTYARTSDGADTRRPNPAKADVRPGKFPVKISA